MEEYLRSHPLISTTGIEKALGLTHGTLRKGKSIPERHLDKIAELLHSYGYGGVADMPETVFKPVGEQYIIKRVKIGITDYAYKIGRMEGKLFMSKNDIPDNTPVILG